MCSGLFQSMGRWGPWDGHLQSWFFHLNLLHCFKQLAGNVQVFYRGWYPVNRGFYRGFVGDCSIRSHCVRIPDPTIKSQGSVSPTWCDHSDYSSRCFNPQLGGFTSSCPPGHVSLHLRLYRQGREWKIVKNWKKYHTESNDVCIVFVKEGEILSLTCLFAGWSSFFYSSGWKTSSWW